MIGLLLLMSWYAFILFFMHFCYKKLIIERKDLLLKEDELRINLIKEKRIKSLEEQLVYTKYVDQSYISFPLLLVIITVFTFLFFNLSRLIVNIWVGLLVSVLVSLSYSFIINLLKPTRNKDFYFILIFLYCLFIAVSILVNKFIGVNVHWSLVFVLFIFVYYICKSKLKWMI